MNKIVGIIGLGSVGKSVYHALNFFFPCKGYDIKGDYYWEDILETQIAFICVPTPEGCGGRLDCSIVKSVINRLNEDDFKGIVVVKSTVGVGFMDECVMEHPHLRLVYMPEFLREKSNFTWFVAPDRLVISGLVEDVNETLEYFYWVEDDAQVLRMSHREAEIGKLAHNAYIATKVSFTNEIETICRENNANPEKVMGVIWADRRVKSTEHLKPHLGPYGGKCVPKDTKELLNSSRSTLLLDAVESVNKKAMLYYGDCIE